MAKHYIITHEIGRVLRGFSDDFEQPDASAICINEDGGRHFELDGVVNPPMTDWYGAPLYKFDGKQVIERTKLELDADKPVITHILAPSIEERTSALESALLELILEGFV